MDLIAPHDVPFVRATLAEAGDGLVCLTILKGSPTIRLYELNGFARSGEDRAAFHCPQTLSASGAAKTSSPTAHRA